MCVLQSCNFIEEFGNFFKYDALKIFPISIKSELPLCILVERTQIAIKARAEAEAHAPPLPRQMRTFKSLRFTNQQMHIFRTCAQLIICNSFQLLFLHCNHFLLTA